ncbi:hypothetical protein [Undibacterium sp.]|uniref:hypothetical protein n=1 Tax=Undibacterium sp. TaxID=1914977 RepID=UPI003753A1C3
MTKQSVLEEIDAVFGPVIRPKKFTVEDGDPECMDHDALLKSRTRETLSLADVGNLGYDPLCECLPEGIAYFFPTLARFALSTPVDSFSWYGGQLIFHLSYNGKENKFLCYCSKLQRATVASLLKYIIDNYQELIHDDGSEWEEFESCYLLWKNDCK